MSDKQLPYVKASERRCPECFGEGMLEDYRKDEDGEWLESYIMCPSCEGCGTIEGENP